MAVHLLDTLGLKCPQPMLKLAVLSAQVSHGDMVEILGDCPTFESDIRTWCQRVDKTLLVVIAEGGLCKRIRIQF